MGALFAILWCNTFEDSPYSPRNVFQAFYKNKYDRINKLSYFKCSLPSRINKLRDIAIELGSKCTFLKTWNSLLNNNGSLNCSFISWFFSFFKSLMKFYSVCIACSQTSNESWKTMFRIIYSTLTFGREISLKVLPYIIIGWFTFLIQIIQ